MERWANSCDLSEVSTSQRPDSSDLALSSEVSKVIGVYFRPLARKKSDTFSSVVVPAWMQMVAPSSSLALETPSFLLTRKPTPS
ncbi:hypothetical protein D3C80_1998960 [compost metagenome]